MADPRKLKDEAATASAKGRHRKAAELYQQIALVERDDAQWPHRAGESWKRAGEKASAISQLTVAADGYARTGFFLKAISVAKMILEIDPGRTEAQAMLAALYARRDERDPRMPARASSSGLPVSGPAPARPAAPAVPLARAPSSPPAFMPALPPPLAAPFAGPPLSPAPFSPAPFSPAPQGPPSAPLFAPLSPVPPPPLFPPPIPSAKRDVTLELDPLDIVTIDEAPPIPAPRNAPSMPAPRQAPPPPPPAALDFNLSDRIPGSRISQEFSITAFEIPIESPPLPKIDPRGLPEIPLFSSLDEQQLHHLIQGASIVRCTPEQKIVRQGERGDALYVVVHGAVLVRVDGVAEPVARLGEGEFFGELALLSDQPRQATVEAEGDAEVLEIGRDVVWGLIEESPDVLGVLLRFFRDRLIGRLTTTSPLFASLPPEESRQVADRFQFLELKSGTALVTEGERAEGLFVVLLGRGEVSSRAMGTIATVGPGDLVGEMSLLMGGPASATVTASTPLWALALPRANFQEVILTHPQVLIYVNEVAEQRKNADLQRLDFF